VLCDAVLSGRVLAGLGQAALKRDARGAALMLASSASVSVLVVGLERAAIDVAAASEPAPFLPPGGQGASA